MTRAQTWSMHVSNLLVGGTGLLYGYFRYLAVPEDEFSVVNHPMQPDVHHLHILLAPLLVFACGWIWQNHVWKRIRSGYPRHRKSGWFMIGTLFPMIFSGYLVQICQEESWRLAWVWVHGITSCVWLLFAVIHPLLPRRTVSR